MRYMAGYTAFKLLKKYKKISHIRNFSKSDRCLYVAVLKGMKADEADREDCTSEWTERIDRGSLFHVTQQVYLVMELLNAE